MSATPSPGTHPPNRAELRRWARLLVLGAPAAGGWLLLLGRVAGGHWPWREAAWLVGGFAGAGLLFLAVPGLAPPFYRVWHLLTRFLEAVLRTVLLTAFFYAVLTPAGWVRRRLHRSPLELGPDPQRATYWRPAPPAPAPDRYFRPF